MSFGWVPPPVPRWLWVEAERLLAPAIAYSGREWDMGEIAADVMRGGRQLWVYREGGEFRGVVLTATDDSDMEIELFGGPLAEVARIAGIEAAARAAGMATMTINGRPGWARVLGPIGWRTVNRDDGRVVLRRELTDG